MRWLVYLFAIAFSVLTLLAAIAQFRHAMTLATMPLGSTAVLVFETCYPILAILVLSRVSYMAARGRSVDAVTLWVGFVFGAVIALKFTWLTIIDFGDAIIWAPIAFGAFLLVVFCLISRSGLQVREV